MGEAKRRRSLSDPSRHELALAGDEIIESVLTKHEIDFLLVQFVAIRVKASQEQMERFMARVADAILMFHMVKAAANGHVWLDLDYKGKLLVRKDENGRLKEILEAFLKMKQENDEELAKINQNLEELVENIDI